MQLTRVQPLVDETGLGLPRFGVTPPVALAGTFDAQSLDGQLKNPDGVSLGNIVLNGLQTLTDLSGIELEAKWQTLEAEPEPSAGKLLLQPGSLVPIALQSARSISGGRPSSPQQPVTGRAVGKPPIPSLSRSTGGPANPAGGLDVRLVPVPELSHDPQLWESELEVTLTATAFGVSRTLAVPLKIPLSLPTLALPPIAILCTGKHFQLPALAICPVPGLGGSLDGLLGHLTDVLLKVDFLKRLLIPEGYLLPELFEVTDAVRFLLRFLNGGAVRFLPSPSERNLNQFELMLGIINDLEAEDEIASLIYFGLPDATLEIFGKRKFEGERLQVGVTDAMAKKGDFLVLIDDLADCAGEPGVLSVKGKGLNRFLFWSASSSYRFNSFEGTVSLGKSAALTGVRIPFLERFTALRERGADLLELMTQRRKDHIVRRANPIAAKGGVASGGAIKAGKAKASS